MKRVLVIDDDAKVRGLLRLLLHESGFDVVEASDGKEGALAFRCLRPDLVLCDVFMPDQDGLETIRALTREFPGVKIIALSGGGFQGTMDLLPVAKRLGASACIRKPFHPGELLVVVEQVLGTAASSA